jgi:hypothetical protein
MQSTGQSEDCPLCTTTIVEEVLAKVPACNPGAARIVLALHSHPSPPHPVAFPCHRCQHLPSHIPPLAPLLILGLYKTSTVHIAVSLNTYGRKSTSLALERGCNTLSIQGLGV